MSCHSTADHESEQMIGNGPAILAVGDFSNDGNDWFVFNKAGDGGVKDKATDLSTFESQFATDIDWLNSGL
jgi:hypothetical protein